MVVATHANAAELQQLSSFYRLLNQAAASRSEREIMRVFVEALAVWQDAESWAYFADVTGRFVLDVALPGSDRSRVPAAIDQSALTLDSSIPTRVHPEELPDLKFRDCGRLLMSRIQVRGASDWLIVTEDPGDADAEARLVVYVQAVVQALNEVNAIHSSRLTWAMLEHLLPAAESLAFPAQGAVEELAASAEATAWFTVFAADGSTVLAAGDLMSVLARPEPARTPSVLILPLEIGGPYRAAIGLRRAAERPLTGRDEQLLRLAASTLTTWLNAVIDRLTSEHERRSNLRTFDKVLKRRVEEAVGRGEQISVIVISLGADVSRTDFAHDCVGRIRQQLRPADMAGRLSSGHIGVVLPDTPTRDAHVVIERLRQLLVSPNGNGAPQPSIGLAKLPVNGSDPLSPEESSRPDLQN